MYKLDVLTIRSACRWECYNITNFAIIGLVRDARQSLLVPEQLSTCGVVDAVVPRPVHCVDLLANVEEMTVLGVVQPELSLRVVAPTAVWVRPCRQTNTHDTGTQRWWISPSHGHGHCLHVINVFTLQYNETLIILLKLTLYTMDSIIILTCGVVYITISFVIYLSSLK